MAEPERDAPQATPTKPTDPRSAEPNYSLSEVAFEALADVAPSLGAIELRVMLELLRQFLRAGHAIKSSSRELATLLKVSRSNIVPAIDRLIKLNYLSMRRQNGSAQTKFEPNIQKILKISGPILGPVAKITGPESGPVFPQFASLPVLNQDHTGPNLGPVPTDSKALTRGAPPLDSELLRSAILDRVLTSKISDHDKDVVRTFRRSLQYFMNKFGVDPQDRRYLDSGQPPHPPDDEILARFLSVAQPQQLMDMLENLIIDAKTEDHRTPESGPHGGGPYNPRSYAWFFYIALSRIEGIHFSKTKKAEQQFRLHKKGQRAAPPAAAEQGGLDFAEQILNRAITGSKKL